MEGHQRLVTPDSDVHKTSDDNLPIADLFKRKKGKEKVKATRCIDIDNHDSEEEYLFGYCSDFDEYPSVKQDQVFDIDRCDTEKVKATHHNAAFPESPCLSCVENHSSTRIGSSNLNYNGDDTITILQRQSRKDKEKGIKHNTELCDSPCVSNVEEPKPKYQNPTSPDYLRSTNYEANSEIYENYVYTPPPEYLDIDRSVDVENCDTDDALCFEYPYISEGESIPSDAEDECGDIPSLRPIKLFANKTPGCSSNISYASGMKVMDKGAQFEWIVRNVKKYIKGDIQTKTSTIRIKLLSETKVKIAYLTTRRARIRCLEDMYGSFEESFRLLPQLCSEIRDNNPGSIVTLISNEKTKQFEGLCITYKASLQGFQDGCIPVIALESSPLRGKYGGAVLSATSIDANNGMFPVAIYICMSTCFDTWDKFLSTIAPSLNKVGRNISFFPRFDRFSKGCQQAVKKNFKNQPQRLCPDQLDRELKNTNFGNEFFHYNRVRAAGTEYNRRGFELKMDELQSIYPLVEQWLERLGEGWARHQFEVTSNCRHMSNILGMAFNKWVKGLRFLPICNWVRSYEGQLFKLFDMRSRKFTSSWRNLVPKAHDQVWRIRNSIIWFTVDPQTLNNDVRSVKENCSESCFEIDLKKRECTCGEWQVSGIPCVHAMAVIVKEAPAKEANGKVESYVDECYTMKMYKASYAGTINQSMTERLPETRTVLNPPLLKDPRNKTHVISRQVEGSTARRVLCF